MLFNAIEGVVENGKIRLPDEVTLPENARVFVIVAESASSTPPRIPSPRLANPGQAADFRKQLVEVPPDARV